MFEYGPSSSKKDIEVRSNRRTTHFVTKEHHIRNRVVCASRDDGVMYLKVDSA